VSITTKNYPNITVRGILLLTPTSIRLFSDGLFAREQEARPGVDQRDEVLHKMERAQSKEEANAAAHAFLRWLEELEVLE
jgi:hypothetical protein